METRKHILVVEDEKDIAMMVKSRLEASGFDVDVAFSGEEGLQKMDGSISPDLVVLDWMMPRMTGIEVCLEIRKDPSLADIPVLFLTAKAQEADVQRGFAAGGNDYVVKPFSPRELSTRIDALLARVPR